MDGYTMRHWRPSSARNRTRTVDVEACRMRHFSGSVLGDARVLAAVLHHDVRDIDVTNDVAVHRHVLSNHEPMGVGGRVRTM